MYYANTKSLFPLKWSCHKSKTKVVVQLFIVLSLYEAIRSCETKCAFEPIKLYSFNICLPLLRFGQFIRESLSRQTIKAN